MSQCVVLWVDYLKCLLCARTLRTAEVTKLSPLINWNEHFPPTGQCLTRTEIKSSESFFSTELQPPPSTHPGQRDPDSFTRNIQQEHEHLHVHMLMVRVSENGEPESFSMCFIKLNLKPYALRGA